MVRSGSAAEFTDDYGEKSSRTNITLLFCPRQ